MGCKINRIPVEKIEEKVRKALFSLIRTDQRKKQFAEILTEFSGKEKKTYTLLTKDKEKELNEIKKRKANLMKVLSFTEDEEAMQSILSEVKELDRHYKQVEVELDRAIIKAQGENQSISIETIMEGISSLKGDKFRKKTLSSKKAIIQSVIKSIHINPDNVIRIDVWGGKNRPERPERSQPTQAGAVLPFYKKAKIFEFSDIKKPAAFRTPVRMVNRLVGDLNR